VRVHIRTTGEIWAVDVEDVGKPDFSARQVWQMIERGEALSARVADAGEDPQFVVFNPAHVVHVVTIG
jgi:hypothetical protein